MLKRLRCHLPNIKTVCLYLVVLVGRHSDEGSLREDVGAESRVFGAKAIILVRLDNMETWLVFVHGVEYYLQRGRD